MAGVVLSVALNVGLVTTVGVISHGKSQHKHVSFSSELKDHIQKQNLRAPCTKGHFSFTIRWV